MKQKIFVTTEFPGDLERKIRIAAAKRGISRSAMIRLITRQFMEKETSASTAPMEVKREASPN